jgi:hypothetical protein
MSSINRFAVIVFYVAALHFSPALALHSRLSGFSSDFVRDYDSAEKRVDDLKSAEPLLALLEKYTNPMERAELELSIGFVTAPTNDSAADLPPSWTQNLDSVIQTFNPE